MELEDYREGIRTRRDTCREKLKWGYGRLTENICSDSNKESRLNIPRLSKSSNTDIDSSLVKSLLDPVAFPHPVEKIELIETHISWVILTGPYAYKIKKPVKLAFLDFRNLQRRRFFCEEEIRLNRTWTPEIYLDVVTINQDKDRLRISGEGPIVEYAVRMQQFDQSARLDLQLAAGTLTVADMRQLATVIAKHHQEAAACGPELKSRILTLTRKFILDNLEPLNGLIQEGKLWSMREWIAIELNKLDTKLRERYDEGFVRDCHGDLHLANLVRLPTGIAAFDRIEFDAKIREIDVANDIAFLVMDLFSKGRSDLGFLVLNRYFEVTGDYDCISLFNLYFVYRCLVRAKIIAISCRASNDSADSKKDIVELHRHFDLAVAQSVKRRPVLVVMHGFSGSGKTWLSERLMGNLPAVRVRSDIERKRMHGLAETAASLSNIGQGLYTNSANEDVYSRLFFVAKSALLAGHNVILDASFLRISERDRARQTASKCAAGFVLLETKSSDKILRDRIRQRDRFGGDASEAGIAILDYQQQSVEPLRLSERQFAVSVCTSDEIDLPNILQRIRLAPVFDNRFVRDDR